ncbi:hypothetical protein KJ840_01780 [Patescibacteria group bacterium]|nr:hypothetical protein [Patescibacteria group bacterium]
MKTKKIAVLAISITILLLTAGIAYAVSYLSVSLNANTPPGGYIWATSTNVAFTTFDFSNAASSTEDIILDFLAVTNSGSSSTTPHVFSQLYLYEDDNLIATTTEAFDTNHFLFRALNYTIPTSTTKALTVKGDLGAEATSTQTIIIGIKGANFIRAHGAYTGTATTIWGNFPVLGNTFTIY